MASVTTELSSDTTVGELVSQRPARSRIFEQLGIDYCCGGKVPLGDACHKKGLDVAAVIAQLAAAEETTGCAFCGDDSDPARMELPALADHIERTHHDYLRRELPRLDTMTEKVARVHGEHDERLVQLRAVFVEFVGELGSHMMKEERILFPMIRQLVATRDVAVLHCGSLAHPIRQMEYEHDAAGGGLAKMRQLTDGYTPPDWACNTYRAMLDGMAELERNMHQHVHKENNVLFPRAIELERGIRG